MARRLATFLWAAALATVAGCGGCDDAPPPDDTFDGNVVIGDASEPDPQDARGRDASPTGDVGVDADAGDADAADPALDGALPDGGSPCAPEAVRTVTASTAVAERAALAGLVVEVVGTATVSRSTCGLPCDAGVCACPCEAQVAIDGVLPLAPSTCFEAPGCQGTACTLVCRPALLGISQRFLGRIALSPESGEAALEIFSVLP